MRTELKWVKPPVKLNSRSVRILWNTIWQEAEYSCQALSRSDLAERDPDIALHPIDVNPRCYSICYPPRWDEEGNELATPFGAEIADEMDS